MASPQLLRDVTRRAVVGMNSQQRAFSVREERLVLEICANTQQLSDTSFPAISVTSDGNVASQLNRREGLRLR